MNAVINFLEFLFSVVFTTKRFFLKNLFNINVFLCLCVLKIFTANAQSSVIEARHLDSALEEVFPAVVNISIVVSENEINNLQIQKSSFPKVFKFFNDASLLFNPTDDNGQEYFRSVGSGIIFDKSNGYIVTNYHVIEDSSSIFVTLYDERVLKAKLIGSDKVTDIAVLKIDGDDLSEIKIANLDSIKIGRFVAAIGNPLQLDYTATFGIISGIHRTNLGIEKYENFIQTDASINRGNSGGALVDFNGRLVGMNTATISHVGGNGFGLAIPVDTVHTIYKKIVKYGKIERGKIGLHLKNIAHSSNNIGKKPHLTKGVFVYNLDRNSPADVAGLKIGDIIVSMDDKPISNLNSAKNELILKCISENIKLKFLRYNKEQLTTLLIK